MRNPFTRRKKNRRSTKVNYGPPGGDTMERRSGPKEYFAVSKREDIKVKTRMTTQRKEDLIKNPVKRAFHKTKGWLSYLFRKP
tara:strand:- start:1063 stop:1311 length:249 start_codon:yes stop_codon:yes gene_type:complete